MASDHLVGAKLILRAQLEVERRGVEGILSELEQVEPDLAEFAIERMCDLHRRLLNLRSRPKATQRIHRQMQALVLTSILALRKGHYELWQNQEGEEGSAEDPPASSDPSAP
ncbi:MAG TPA: hypothetical protein VFE58_07905 [Tepidisphaeraceae bacterium]|jgi:hypothetical protein|nr:hypothetical protein [Tepidisphaeraceae bacterium]